jgi:hypothetical protein
MELWERRRFEHDQSERRMPWGTPQDPRSAPQPRRASARRQVGKTCQGGSRPTSTADPHRSCAPPGHEGGAAKTQSGTTIKKEAPSEPPTPLQDEDPGTGSGRSEGVEDNRAPAGDSPRAGHRPRIQGGRRAQCS